MCERSNRKPRAYQQNHRKRHFDDNENALRAITRAASTASAFFERFVQIRLRSFERWHESKEQSCDERDNQCEKQHPRIDTHVVCPRQRAGRTVNAALVPQEARSKPNAPPATASRMLSVNN